MKRINQMTIKEINRQNLLNTFLEEDYLTANQMRSKTGLTNVTTNAIIKELLDDEWILESHYAASSGGRKPMVYQFNKERNYIMHLSIRKNEIYLNLVNLRGDKKYTIRKSIALKGNASLISLLEEFLMDKPLQQYFHRLLAVAVTIPGIIDTDSATVLYSSPLKIKDFNFKVFFQDKIRDDLSVYVFKRVDALLMDVSDCSFQDQKTAYILIDDGLGLSIMDSNHCQLSRRKGSEIGHIVVEEGGEEKILGDLYRHDYLVKKHNLYYPDKKLKNYDELLVKYENPILQKDEFMNDLEDDIAHIAANVVNLFAPNQVIIGGGVAEYLSSDRIYQKMVEHVLVPFRKNLRIDVSSIDSDKITNGSVHYVLYEKVFRIPF